jgi:hypothetical protein
MNQRKIIAQRAHRSEKLHGSDNDNKEKNDVLTITLHLPQVQRAGVQTLRSLQGRSLLFPDVSTA